MEKTNDNIKQLLEKIKALAINGVDGEKENAQLLLKKLMLKYNISDNDIIVDKKTWRDVTIPRFRLHNKLFWHIIFSTTDTKGYIKTKKRDVIKLELTQAELIEILAKYEFYSKHFDRDLNAFMLSFVSKNNLFPKRDSEQELKPLSPEKMEEIMRAREFMKAQNKYQYGSSKQQLQLDFEDEDEPPKKEYYNLSDYPDEDDEY